MLQKILTVTGMFVLLALPFATLFLLNEPVKQLFKKQGIKLRLIDLLPVYFFMGIHIFSLSAFQKTLLPHVIILLAVLGIGLASTFHFKQNNFQLKRFLRILWRLTDLVSMAAFVILGLLYFITLFF